MYVWLRVGFKVGLCRVSLRFVWGGFRVGLGILRDRLGIGLRRAWVDLGLFFGLV